jgi:hypothetical protein
VPLISPQPNHRGEAAPRRAFVSLEQPHERTAFDLRLADEIKTVTPQAQTHSYQSRHVFRLLLQYFLPAHRTTLKSPF